MPIYNKVEGVAQINRDPLNPNKSIVRIGNHLLEMPKGRLERARVRSEMHASIGYFTDTVFTRYVIDYLLILFGMETVTKKIPQGYKR